MASRKEKRKSARHALLLFERRCDPSTHTLVATRSLPPPTETSIQSKRTHPPLPAFEIWGHDGSMQPHDISSSERYRVTCCTVVLYASVRRGGWRGVGGVDRTSRFVNAPAPRHHPPRRTLFPISYSTSISSLNFKVSTLDLNSTLNSP